MKTFYGEDPQQSPDYGRPVNRQAFDRLQVYMGSGKAVVGGRRTPTTSTSPPPFWWTWPGDSPIMKEEVFGPILPVLEIDSVEAVIEWIEQHPPSAGDSTSSLRTTTWPNGSSTPPGRGMPAVNDCSIHPLVPELPFGGVGTSGMGKYHGHWGFEAFTNARGVLYHGAKLDPGVQVSAARRPRVRAQGRDKTPRAVEPVRP